jgi:GNAT superfamily N-acetyltransferase
VPADIEIRAPRTAEEFRLYYDLRWRILRQPWTQPRESEKDEHEEGAVHLIAWCDGRVAGVGRLHFTGPDEAQIRFMAVEHDWQGRGIGGLILARLEDEARAGGARRMVLNARDAAVRFYSRHGYAISGESEPLFDSIPHWQMRKTL